MGKKTKERGNIKVKQNVQGKIYAKGAYKMAKKCLGNKYRHFSTNLTFFLKGGGIWFWELNADFKVCA